MKKYKGQFPSKNCECHFQEPYGFVPEADCPEHDTKQFIDFLNLLKQKWVEETKKIINEAVKETTKEHKSPNVYIDMVGEIAIEKLENLLDYKGGGETLIQTNNQTIKKLLIFNKERNDLFMDLLDELFGEENVLMALANLWENSSKNKKLKHQYKKEDIKPERWRVDHM